MKKYFISICLCLCFLSAASLPSPTENVSKKSAAPVSGPVSQQAPKTTVAPQSLIPPIDREGVERKLQAKWEADIHHMATSWKRAHGFLQDVKSYEREVPPAIPLQKKIGTEKEHLSYMNRKHGWSCLGCTEQGYLALNHLVVDWDWFLYKSKIYAAREGYIYKKETDKRKGWATCMYSNRPKYEKFLKDKKFIFIWDGAGHGKADQAREQRIFLQAVRAANPGARILLAFEFARLENTYNGKEMPVYKSLLSTPTQPAQEVKILDEYKGLAKLAAENEMDMLALDDTIWVQNEDKILFKAGNELVSFPYDMQAVSADEPLGAKGGKKMRLRREVAEKTTQFFKKFDLNYSNGPEGNKPENKSKEIILQTVLGSAFGAELRNRQWAEYINAVSSFYDIVIVHAGYGHLGLKSKIDYDKERTVDFSVYTVSLDEKLLEKNKQINEACNLILKNDQEGVGEFLEDAICDGKETGWEKRGTYSKIYGNGEKVSVQNARSIEVWLPK